MLLRAKALSQSMSIAWSRGARGSRARGGEPAADRPPRAGSSATVLAVVAGLWLTALSLSAAAQDQNTEVAREKFKEGVSAYDAGEYEKARTLFLQAYALKRHPLVLLNLGQTELKAGHVEDGGNHLQQFLREHKAATEQQRKDAEAGIAEAQKRTGYLILIVDTDGAALAVDGAAIGVSPLADPYFVTPGKHKASASLGGKTTETEVDVKKGTATPVTLNLGGGGVVAPVPVVEPTPAPSPSPDGYTPNPVPPPYPVMPPPPPGPMGGMPPGGDTGREDLWPWFKRRPVAWALFGVAGASLVGTIVFGALAGNRDANVGSFQDQIEAEVQAGEDGKASAKLPPQYWSNGDGTGQPQPCGTFDDPSSAFGHYAGACDQLRGEIDARDDLLIGVGVSVGLFAVSTAGLIIYYFVDTGSKRSSATIVPVPIITPDSQGASLVGTF